MTFVVQFHFNLPTPTTSLAFLLHNNELPRIRHNESASTCSGICLWISYGDLKHFTYACLASRHEHGHSGNRATLNGNANNCNCMWGSGEPGLCRSECVSGWLGKSLLGCRDRTGQDERAEPLAGGKAHSISVIAGCPNPWRPQVSIASQATICHSSGEQETPLPAPAPSPSPRPVHRRHQNQSGNKWQRSHSAAIWTVSPSVCPTVCLSWHWKQVGVAVIFVAVAAVRIAARWLAVKMM